MAGACIFHSFCQCVEAGAGSHDVIQQYHAFFLQVSRAFKSAMHVPDALLVWQAGLWRGGFDALAGMQVDRYGKLPADDPGDFHGLIEAALLDALGMQGHGDDAVRWWQMLDVIGQQMSHGAGQWEQLPVFVLLQYDRKRELVLEQAAGGVKSRRRLEALPTEKVAWAG